MTKRTDQDIIAEEIKVDKGFTTKTVASEHDQSHIEPLIRYHEQKLHSYTKDKPDRLSDSELADRASMHKKALHHLRSLQSLHVQMHWDHES